MSYDNLTPDVVHNIIESCPCEGRYYLGLSGGVDSIVLLHLLYLLRDKYDFSFTAIHVNHQLQKNAEQWQNHCVENCQRLDIPLVTSSVSEKPAKGESLEAWARTERYKIFSNHVEPGDCLITAHHLDDQVETFFINLFRGAGINGLTSMPLHARINELAILRPLLNIQRSAITSYAIEHGLEWLEDESNQDIRFDRNYLRQELLPMLYQRWPSLPKTIQRSIENLGECRRLLEEIAADDLRHISTSHVSCVDIEKLKMLSSERQNNVLRYWLNNLGFSMPSKKRFEILFNEVINSEIDKIPEIKWNNCEVHRYQNRLYAIPTLSQSRDRTYVLRPAQTVHVGSGSISFRKVKGTGLKETLLANGQLEVRFRQGGESIIPSNHDCHKEVKKIFQEYRVLPWMRDQLPFLYKDDELVAISDMILAKEYTATDSEIGYLPVWDADKQYPVFYDNGSSR